VLYGFKQPEKVLDAGRRLRRWGPSGRGSRLASRGSWIERGAISPRSISSARAWGTPWAGSFGVEGNLTSRGPRPSRTTMSVNVPPMSIPIAVPTKREYRLAPHFQQRDLSLACSAVGTGEQIGSPTAEYSPRWWAGRVDSTGRDAYHTR